LEFVACDVAQSDYHSQNNLTEFGYILEIAKTSSIDYHSQNNLTKFGYILEIAKTSSIDYHSQNNLTKFGYILEIAKTSSIDYHSQNNLTKFGYILEIAKTLSILCCWGRFLYECVLLREEAPDQGCELEGIPKPQPQENAQVLEPPPPAPPPFYINNSFFISLLFPHLKIKIKIMGTWEHIKLGVAALPS